MRGPLRRRPLPISRSKPVTFLRQVPTLHTLTTKMSSNRGYSAPSQHVAVLRILQDKHEFVDAIDLILDALNKRTERVRNVVDERVRYPVRCDRDVVAKLFDSAANVLWMRCCAEMELQGGW